MDTLKIIIWLICTFGLCCVRQDDTGDSPEIIESRGFKCETHQIVTSDGYILTTFRIINPLTVEQLKHQTVKLINYKPILLQSVLYGSSDDYIMISPDGHLDPALFNSPNADALIDYYNGSGRNLGFLLANLGYDVWLTNFRANYYSRNHTTLDPDSTEFWKTGWDEMALIDLPMTIDYVLKLTKRETVGYIGVSRGSSVMFALLSEKLEYNLKVKPFIAMAPAIYFDRWSIQLVERSTKLLTPLNNLFRYLALYSPGECLGRGISKRVKKCAQIQCSI